MAFQKWLGFRSSPRGSVPVKRRSLAEGPYPPREGSPAAGQPVDPPGNARRVPLPLRENFRRLRQRVPRRFPEPPVTAPSAREPPTPSGNETGRPGVEARTATGAPKNPCRRSRVVKVPKNPHLPEAVFLCSPDRNSEEPLPASLWMTHFDTFYVPIKSWRVLL